MSVVWHDLECGGYCEDLPLWHELASRHRGQLLDVGAGTGRTALALARTGVSVTALDSDRELLAELRRRSEGLELRTALADARDFHLKQRFALCIMPMQTIQLLGGSEGRKRFLACAREHLVDGGIVAIALADELECFEVSTGGPFPLPDVCECDGILYASRPTAVRDDGDGFVLERRREVVAGNGTLSVEQNRIRLDRLDAPELELEATEIGMRPAGRGLIPPTPDHVGSVVVMLDA